MVLTRIAKKSQKFANDEPENGNVPMIDFRKKVDGGASAREPARVARCALLGFVFRNIMTLKLVERGSEAHPLAHILEFRPVVQLSGCIVQSISCLWAKIFG